jgi:hypothetical protein
VLPVSGGGVPLQICTCVQPLALSQLSAVQLSLSLQVPQAAQLPAPPRANVP